MSSGGAVLCPGAHSLLCQGAPGGLITARAEARVGLDWTVAEWCGGRDQTLAFQWEGKLAMAVSRAVAAAQCGGYRPAPGAGLASSSTTLVKLLSRIVPQCPHL